jgi:hypothetical protein
MAGGFPGELIFGSCAQTASRLFEEIGNISAQDGFNVGQFHSLREKLKSEKLKAAIMGIGVHGRERAEDAPFVRRS